MPSPAPADRPAVADEDVIRTAFIYKRAKAEPVGTSHILPDPAFANAREPLAQAFRPAGGTADQDFLVIVNHFKSKGSGVDDGTGQGNANPDRVAQAKALVAFADQQKRARGTDLVFLTGDFNSYTQEDPLQVLYDAGLHRHRLGAGARASTPTSSTAWSARSTTCSPTRPRSRRVTGAHVWNINSVESVAYEYSRYNYNATDFYAPTRTAPATTTRCSSASTCPAPPAATTTTATVASPVRWLDRPIVHVQVDSTQGVVAGGTVEVREYGMCSAAGPSVTVRST